MNSKNRTFNTVEEKEEVESTSRVGWDRLASQSLPCRQPDTTLTLLKVDDAHVRFTQCTAYARTCINNKDRLSLADQTHQSFSAGAP